MTIQQKGLIALIKSALTGEKCPIPDSFSLTEAIETIERHNIFSLVYYGALNCGYEKDSAIMKEMFSKSCAQLMIDEKQTQAVKEIFYIFETEQIDYLPLKGIVLKGLYPNTIMRAMGDIDVLVRHSQVKAAKQALLELGFCYSHEDDHESVWKKGVIVVDLHTRLMTAINKKFSTLFRDGWKVAEYQKDTSCRCFMSDENFFLFLFNHFAKHYSSSGVGIKHVVDLYVFITSKALNYEYITSMLKRMGLYTFYVNVTKMLNTWFQGADSDEKIDFITSVIFHSGEFGQKEKAEVGGLVREARQRGSITRTRMIRFLRVVFLPLNIMRTKYKILGWFPFLLPIAWGVRLFDILINKRDIIKQFLEKNRNISKEDIKKHQEDLIFAGFNFEE